MRTRNKVVWVYIKNLISNMNQIYSITWSFGESFFGVQIYPIFICPRKSNFFSIWFLRTREKSWVFVENTNTSDTRKKNCETNMNIYVLWLKLEKSRTLHHCPMTKLANYTYTHWNIKLNFKIFYSVFKNFKYWFLIANWVLCPSRRSACRKTKIVFISSSSDYLSASG